MAEKGYTLEDDVMDENDFTLTKVYEIDVPGCGTILDAIKNDSLDKAISLYKENKNLKAEYMQVATDTRIAVVKDGSKRSTTYETSYLITPGSPFVIEVSVSWEGWDVLKYTMRWDNETEGDTDDA